MKSNKEQFKICVSGAAQTDICCSNIQELAKEVGREIAKEGHILLTGATTGVPYLAACGAKEVGGISIGFSPASSEKEHLKRYKLPIDKFDLICYTGFDYVGRNLILTKSADGVIIICGRTGTLNEFTVAFETKTPIGVLEGSGGIADLIREILSQGHRPKTSVIFEKDPKILVQKLVQLIKKEKKLNH